MLSSDSAIRDAHPRCGTLTDRAPRPRVGKHQVVVPLSLSRIHVLNTLPLKNDGRFVLYWMITARRLRFNFALQHAVEFANPLRLPLVISRRSVATIHGPTIDSTHSRSRG